mgnify:CR=1 FL=1
MTRQEFVDQLIENGINPDIVLFDFDNNVRDGYCIRKNYFRWEVLKGKEKRSFVAWVSRRRVMH